MLAIGTGSVNCHGKQEFVEWESPDQLKIIWIFYYGVFKGLHYTTNQ